MGIEIPEDEDFDERVAPPTALPEGDDFAPPLDLRIAWGRPEFAADLVQLSAFVRWFVFAYRVSDDVIPPCWYRHRDVTGYLAGLWQYYETIYHPDQAATGGAFWHDFMARYVGYLRSCTSTLRCVADAQHSEPRVPSWVSDGTAKWQAEFASHLSDLDPSFESGASL